MPNWILFFTLLIAGLFPTIAAADDVCWIDSDVCPAAETVPLVYAEKTCLDAQMWVVDASYYADRFHGLEMANGEEFDMHDETIVAHKSLPLGAELRVYCPLTGTYINLEVSDRGPYIKGRVLDFSLAAAKKCGLIGPGIASVVMEVILS